MAKSRLCIVRRGFGSPLYNFGDTEYTQPSAYILQSAASFRHDPFPRYPDRHHRSDLKYWHLYQTVVTLEGFIKGWEWERLHPAKGTNTRRNINPEQRNMSFLSMYVDLNWFFSRACCGYCPWVVHSAFWCTARIVWCSTENQTLYSEVLMEKCYLHHSIIGGA